MSLWLRDVHEMETTGGKRATIVSCTDQLVQAAKCRLLQAGEVDGTRESQRLEDGGGLSFTQRDREGESAVWLVATESVCVWRCIG